MALQLGAALPAHCQPTNNFLSRFSSTFHTCVPTPLAFTSNVLGALSILAWLFAQVPQIYKNFNLSSTSGLSIYFLAEWFLGDLCNLLGAIFTHQASWQVTIGGYYVLVDLCLLSQWLWYEKIRHADTLARVRSKRTHGEGGAESEGIIIDGVPLVLDVSCSEDTNLVSTKGRDEPITRPQIVFRALAFKKERPPSSLAGTSSRNHLYRMGASSPLPSPSAKILLLIACIVAIAQAAPARTLDSPHPSLSAAISSRLETAGTVLAWISTTCYLASRLPQIYKNYVRKSTAGLSPLLFLAAFCGNFCYSLALLTNPCAWSNFEPYGKQGWVGSEGSQRTVWILAALPFFLGAAGVLALDASIGLQFLMYAEQTEKVVVGEEVRNHRRHWGKVSGWMKGWVPWGRTRDNSERAALTLGSDLHGERYGTL